MHYHSSNYRQHTGHHLGNQFPAKQRKTRNGGRRKILKKLKKLSSVDLNDIINFMSAYSPRNLSTKRKLIIAGMALALVTTLGVTWYLSKQNQTNLVDNCNPQISELKYKPKISPGIVQNINFTAVDVGTNNATIPGNIAKALVEVTNPSGHSANETARRLENIENHLFSAQFNKTTEEGNYKIRAIVEDKAGNVAIKHGSFDVGDNPAIHSFSLEKIPSKGLAKILVNASDTSGVAKAEIEFNGNKEDMVRLPNGLFSYNITMPENPADMSVKVYVKDPFNQTSSTTAEIDWSSKDAFITFAFKKGYSTELAGKLYDNSNLTRQLFDEDRATLANVLKIASNNATDLPKNLAYKVLEQIEKDSRVSNKITLAKNVFDNLAELETYGFDRIDSIWLINNATRNGFKDLEGLKKALQFSEGNNVSLNFENTLSHSALADTGAHFPQIFKYPQETKYLALQVGDAIYLFEIDKIKGKDYVWAGLVVPYSEWRFERLENGTFESLGQKLLYGELAELSKWADKKVVEAAARSLYPFDELMDHDLLGSNSERYFHDENFDKALERGIVNIKHNGTIGASPFEYIYRLLLDDIETKSERYQRAFNAFEYSYPREPWPNSWDVWHIEAEKHINASSEIALVKGFPIALKIYDPPANPNFYITEQASPYYSKIIGAMLNRPTIVLGAPYPGSINPDHPYKHNEPFPIGKNGEPLGFWYKLDTFLDDYDPEKNPYANPDVKPFIKLMVVSDRISKRFNYDQLEKVLNS